MIETLMALTETLEFEDSGGFRFVSARRIGDGLELDLALIATDDGKEQQWRVQCVGVRDYRLDGEFAEDLCVVAEHPVLLPFTDDICDLYFSCAAPNPLETLGALWERHRQSVGEWLPFEQFLNVLRDGLVALLASPSGKFASGPVSLLRAYREVLTQHGVRTSMLEPRPQKYWDGARWVVQTNRPHALVLNTSWVVAERFDAERLAI